jgi:hypothetical protein
MSGIIADMMAIPINIVSMFGQITSFLGNIMSNMFFIEIIMMIIILGRCIFLGIMFIVKFLEWFFVDFILWAFVTNWQPIMNPKRDDGKHKVNFLCWLIRYIIVIAYKISTLPKCFLWYFLDTAGWILYLPFRLTFWIIDWALGTRQIEDMEHKAWRFLDELDYFLHGRPRENYFMYQYSPADTEIDSDGKPLGPDGFDPKTLHLGFHIIHFPDSVMFECYSINPYSLLDLSKFPMKEFQDFMSCAMNPFG